MLIFTILKNLLKQTIEFRCPDFTSPSLINQDFITKNKTHANIRKKDPPA